MSFLGKLFGSSKALEQTVDGAIKGLDALVYTDEEKAKYAAVERREARRMIIEWMGSTQGQNLARRLIALSVTAVWLLDIIIAQFVGAVAIFVDTEVTRGNLKELATFMQESSGNMESPVMLVFAFYFAAPHMGDFAKAITGKFKKSVNKG